MPKEWDTTPPTLWHREHRANLRGRLTEWPHHCVSRNRAHFQREHLTLSALCLLILAAFLLPYDSEGNILLWTG